MKGFLTVSSVMTADGRLISTQKAVDYGWITPSGRKPPGWGFSRHEVPLGQNLFVDNGRQYIAYCMGGRSPLSNFYCWKFGIGTGTTAPAVTDTGLEAPIFLDNPPTTFTKEVNGVDYPSPFVARFECVIGANEGVGYLITEMGLFSGDNTLLARSTELSINKTSDFSPVITWRLRF